MGLEDDRTVLETQRCFQSGAARLEESIRLQRVRHESARDAGFHPIADVDRDAVAEHGFHPERAYLREIARQSIDGAGLHQLELDVAGCAELRNTFDVFGVVD